MVITLDFDSGNLSSILSAPSITCSIWDSDSLQPCKAQFDSETSVHFYVDSVTVAQQIPNLLGLGSNPSRRANFNDLCDVSH